METIGRVREPGAGEVYELAAPCNVCISLGSLL